MESGASIGSGLGLLLHLALVYALVSWGRRIADERKTRAWRIASYVPMAGFLASMLGALGTVVGLVRAFGAVTSADASRRAEMLSDGIATAMTSTAVGLGLAVALYVASVIAFLYGSYGPRPDVSR